MRLMERLGAMITAACRSVITRTRLTAATAACLAAVVSVPGPLAGQDAHDLAVGTWAGTLDAGGQQLRIVYDISRGEDDALRGSMAVPAQGASYIPLNELGVEGRTLSMSFPVPGGGSFEGELAASGTEIHGTFTQGGRSFPLELERVDDGEARPSQPQAPTPPRSPLRTAARSVLDDLSPELRQRALGGASTHERLDRPTDPVSTRDRCSHPGFRDLPVASVDEVHGANRVWRNESQVWSRHAPSARWRLWRRATGGLSYVPAFPFVLADSPGMHSAGGECETRRLCSSAG